jgi:signal transduction histidine kinase
MLLEGLFPWLLGALLLPVSVALLALERRDAVRAELLFAQERARLSRDAHDRVYNRLTALAGTLEGAAAVEGAAAPAEEIRSTVLDLQRILGDVDARTASTRDVGAGLFDDLVADQSRRWGMKVSLSGQNAVAGLDARLAWELQCVVEEALTNAGRHGHAAHATVTASRADGTLRIEVTDDGGGIEVPLGPDGLPGNAGGLRGIADRVRTLGGTMALTGGPSGTTVTVEVSV